MGAITSLNVPPPAVAPGQEVTCAVTVRNDGAVVDSFTVVPLGLPAAWASVEPPEVALLPGEEATVRVVFAPPLSWATPAGEHPFGLQVVSREDPEGGVVEEGVLEVGAFALAGAELRPRTTYARGRRAGRVELALDNHGNRPTVMTVQPLDPDHALRFELISDEVEVPAGSTTVVRLGVRAQRRFWKGPVHTVPFQVHVEPAGAGPVTLDGQLVQGSVVPAWVVKALSALLVVAAVLAVLWLTLLKPSIEDSARAAAGDAADQVRAQDAAANAAQQKQIDAAAQQSQEAAATAAKAVKAAASATPGPAASATPGPAPSASAKPMSVRLAATAAQQSPTAVLATTAAVGVTDLLLQNPNGDTGTVTLQRGDSTFYVARLENFRDLDLHLVAALNFGPKQPLRMKVTCDGPGSGAPACTPAVTVLGLAAPAPSPAPSPTATR